MDRLARYVSIALHPFVVLTALTMLATWELQRDAFWRITAGVIVVVAVVWLFVLQRWRSGRWTTVDASDRRERPMLYVVLLALLAAFWLWLDHSAVANGVLAVGAMLCAAGLLNRWIKLSLHMASLAFAAVSADFLHPVAAMVGYALLPLLAWSRLRMARHSWKEVLGGTALGVAFALALQLWG